MIAFLRNHSGVFRRVLTVAPVALLVVAACEQDRATTFAPVGGLGFNFGLQGVPARIPAGTVTVPNSGPQNGNTVIVDVSWLRRLTGSAVYQVWGRTTSGTGANVYTPLFGRLTEYRNRVQCVSGATVCAAASTDTTFDATGNAVFVGDSTVIAATAAGTYVGSDSVRELVTGARFVLSTADAANTVNPAVQEDIVVSIEPAGAATTPSAYKFLWRRISLNNGTGLNRDQNQTVAPAVAMTFGNYGGRDQFNLVSPNDYRFVSVGSGAATIRGDEIVINFINLARPPLGYYYRILTQDSVTRAVGGSNQTLVDTLRSSYSAVSALSRVSMVNADVDAFLPGEGGPEIKSASVRNCLATSTEVGCLNTLALPAAKPFSAILRLVMVLEPKLSSGAVLGRSVVLSGDVPDPAKK